MKKILISAAAVAAVGLSAYLGFRPDPASTLTELQLANAEALSNDELPPVEIICNVPGTGGICHYPDPSKGFQNCGGMDFPLCAFNGKMQNSCPTC